MAGVQPLTREGFDTLRRAAKVERFFLSPDGRYASEFCDSGMLEALNIAHPLMALAVNIRLEKFRRRLEANQPQEAKAI